MERENPLRQKAYAFALHTVHFCISLQKEREYVLSKQYLKAGTSIGANIEEAQQAQSRRDFVSKLCISLKEASESQYWLRFIRDSFPNTKKEAGQLLGELDELLRLLTAIIKSSRRE
ncbi:MAG: four helix bundle protein [Candidatus Peribacteraceae bacterium]|jgi:four helix bundle protein